MKKLLLLATLIPSLALAETVKIAVLDSPPMAIQKDGKGDGIGTHILREIAKRAGIATEDLMMTTPRLPEISNSVPAFFAMVQRVPQREKQVKWVGHVMDDHFCFVTLKKNKPVTTAEEANAVKVGVTGKDVAEEILKKVGVKKYDRAAGSGGSVRKLFAGVIDAWFIRETSGRSSIKHESFNPDDTVCSGNFETTQQWVAASLKLPDEQFAQAQKIFKNLEKEGFVKAAIAKYKD